MKERKKVALLAGLLLVGLFIWYVELRNPSASASRVSAVSQVYTPLGIENPGLHRERLEASRRTEYKSSGRDLFSEVAPPLPGRSVEKPPVQANPQPVVPPPPPLPTLPANVKFFGYGTVPNGTAKRAFLTDGEQVFIVAEGDTLLGKYRIVRIGNANLEFEDTATGLRNSVTLDEQVSPS